MNKLICGCRAVQFAFFNFSSDISCVLKDLFARETNDTLLSLPGSMVPINTELVNKTSLIYKLANWFVDLAHQITVSKSLLLWSPLQQSFINVSIKNHYLGDIISDSKFSSSISMDLFLDKQEFYHILLLTGPQGAKAINSQFLTVVANQVICVIIHYCFLKLSLFLNKVEDCHFFFEES
jgi:hypothetical protein